MRFQATAFALLVSSTSAMAVQVFKCPDGAGKTVIQQTPCEGGTTMDVKPASGAAAPSTSWSGRAKLSKLQRDNEMAEAIRTGNPRVGMTSAQVRQAMGEPAQFASNNYGGGQKEQFVYHRPDATWYVQTVNGLVRSVKRAPPTPGVKAS